VALAVYAEDMIARGLMHEIHTSERRSFRGCRRRWNWLFRQNYYPTVTAKPLEFGIAYHKAMEVLHNPATWKYHPKVLGALAEKAFFDICEQQMREYLRANGEQALGGEVEEDYSERVRLGRGMIWYYVNNQLADIQAKYVPVYVEASFDVPLTDENGEQVFCKCVTCRKAFAKNGGGRWFGNPVVLSGRVDLVVHDMEGYYWILKPTWDWKTAAQLSTSEVFLELDDQIACVPLDSEILTRSGWKHHNQLVVGEEVLGYNGKEDALEWTLLEDVNVYGPTSVVRSRAKSFDFITTPEHRWAKRTHTTTPDHGAYQLQALKNGQQQAYVVLAAELDNPTNDITPDEAAVIAWVLSDGNISRGPRGVQVTIAQSKYVKEIQSLLDRFSDCYSSISKFSGGFGPQGKGVQGLKWHLRAPFFRRLLDKAKLNYELDGWESFVLGLAPKARQVFCETIILAEGHSNKFHQNPGLKNDLFCLAFFLSGKYPTTQHGAKRCQQTVVSEPRKWTRTIVTTNLPEPRPVWCPTTRLGTWVMRQNGQIVVTGNSYCMALRKKLNLNVRGFIYHEQRKAFPEPPKENKQRRLGRLFSVNVNQATSYEVYLAHIKEFDTEAWQEGAYDEFLEHLKTAGTDYYRRFIVYKSDYELDQVEKNLLAEVRDMIDPNLRIYPSPGKFGCNFCAFQTPCISQNSGQDYQYTLNTLYERRLPYYVRQKLGASTESKGGE